MNVQSAESYDRSLCDTTLLLSLLLKLNVLVAIEMQCPHDYQQVIPYIVEPVDLPDFTYVLGPGV